MKKTVLVIEDDDELRTVLRMSLEFKGLQVRAARNGEAAKAMLDDDVNLVLTDLHMPVMDGLSFLNWLRHVEKSEVPVLVLTAMGKDSAWQDVLEAGASGVLRKPIDISELSARVIGVLGQPD